MAERGRAMVAGVRTVAVVGCGQMGSTIAESCARAGFPTTVVGPAPAEIRQVAARMLAGLEAAADCGELDGPARARAGSLLWFAEDLEAVEGVDLVIACGDGPPGARGPLLAAIERSATAAAILASAVPAPLGVLSRPLSRPERLVGLRFAGLVPAGPGARRAGALGRICEVAPAPATEPAILVRAARFVEALGAAAVVLEAPPWRGLAA